MGIRLSNKSKNYSSISLPKKTLDLSIWDKVDNTYELKDSVIEELKSRLHEELEAFGFKGSDKWVKGLYLIGSSTTNLYEPDSDLDVQILVDRTIFEEFND